jgi:hypothetical protein
MANQRLIGGDVVKGIEALYGAVRKRHPELPDVVVCVASGARKGYAVNGHYAASAWQKQDSDVVDELFIAGERLECGEFVLETLLHEAAHALGVVRNVKTTSRGGRYHNSDFMRFANELGLGCEKGVHGWAFTELSEGTADLYGREIDKLDAVLKAARLTEDRPVPKPRSSALKLECGCGRIIRVSAATAEEAEIICGSCRGVFCLDDDQPALQRVIRADPRMRDFGQIVGHVRAAAWRPREWPDGVPY